MSLKKAIMLSAIIAVTHFSAHAEDSSKSPGNGPNPFSDCGIGAALFNDVKWAAVTSNVTWDLGTTAVTSATASPQTCSGKTLKAALFINDTYEKLAEETSRGEGEHLSSLMNIFECGDTHQGRAIEMTRDAMAGAVAKPGYATQDRTTKAAQFYEVIEKAVSSSCSA